MSNSTDHRPRVNWLGKFRIANGRIGFICQSFGTTAWRRVSLTAFISVLASSVYAQANFTPLGDLLGGLFDSQAYGVSADGMFVVGVSTSASARYEAFRWSAAEGMVGLGGLPGEPIDSIAYDVSGNGTVVVGVAFGNPTTGFQAFRWTKNTGLVGLGDLPGGDSRSFALAVSADGSTVVGDASTENAFGMGFRWTADTGMIPLGDLPGGQVQSVAYDVSADGSIVVGDSRSVTINQNEAFRWSSDDGMVGLGDLSGGNFQSTAFGTSADGSVVVGTSLSTNGLEAFRWTAADGQMGLGDLAGGSFRSVASSVSADGSTVVGNSAVSEGDIAFYWTEQLGMVSLREYLLAEGATNLSGWTLQYATDVSADGLTIVGYGVNPAGNREAWVASIPEPSTMKIVAIAIVGLIVFMGCRARRRAEHLAGRSGPLVSGDASGNDVSLTAVCRSAPCRMWW